MHFDVDASALAAAVGAIGGSIATFGASYSLIVRPLRATTTRLRLLFEDWYGEAARPGVDARAGVMERLRSIDDQLKTNGGGSLRDAVTRIEASQHAHLQSHAAAANPTFAPPSPPPYPPAA